MVTTISGNKEIGWLVTILDDTRFRVYSFFKNDVMLSVEEAIDQAHYLFLHEYQYRPEDNLQSCAQAVIALQHQFMCLLEKKDKAYG